MTRHIGFRVPLKLLRAVDRLARRLKRSRSDTLRILIADALMREERKSQAS